VLLLLLLVVVIVVVGEEEGEKGGPRVRRLDAIRERFCSRLMMGG
jgi:hypothetical protein